MSWDVVLFNSNKKIKSVAELDENELVPTDFCAALEKHFEPIIRKDNHREIKRKDFSIDYFIDSEDVSNKMFSIYGEHAIYAMIEFAKKNNYQLYDTGLGAMIDLEKPERNGYKDFQKYLATVLKT